MAMIAVMLTGCAPTPTPTPTPTAPFASEEEAFAAAEETYRAYTDATNRTDLDDPKTFAPVYDWLVGEALTAAIENYGEFHAAKITRTGASTFDTFDPTKYSPTRITVRLCLDVSNVELFDATGASAVPVDRPPRRPIEVEFVPAGTPTTLAISSTIPTSEHPCD